MGTVFSQCKNAPEQAFPSSIFCDSLELPGHIWLVVCQRGDLTVVYQSDPPRSPALTCTLLKRADLYRSEINVKVFAFPSRHDRVYVSINHQLLIVRKSATSANLDATKLDATKLDETKLDATKLELIVDTKMKLQDEFCPFQVIPVTDMPNCILLNCRKQCRACSVNNPDAYSYSYSYRTIFCSMDLSQYFWMCSNWYCFQSVGPLSFFVQKTDVDVSKVVILHTSTRQILHSVRLVTYNNVIVVDDKIQGLSLFTPQGRFYVPWIALIRLLEMLCPNVFPEILYPVLGRIVAEYWLPQNSCMWSMKNNQSFSIPSLDHLFLT